MYADHTLTPKEAIRLCALGSLALGASRYADLAISIRHFISRVIGPTPEIMGHSLELLKYEGLVETIEGSGESALLRITDDGLREMRTLLTANVRPSNTELNTLITALKFRFLHLLPPGDQRSQAELLLAAVERELARLHDLRAHPSGSAGFFPDWLDHHIAALEDRLAWIADFRARLDAAHNPTTPSAGPSLT
jgi:DNA-binding PadR family transcriptional regulator